MMLIHLPQCLTQLGSPPSAGFSQSLLWAKDSWLNVWGVCFLVPAQGYMVTGPGFV